MWIPRNVRETILEAARTRPAILLTGIRQVGKSSLLKRLFPEAEYVTLDKVHIAQEAETNPTKFLQRFKKQVIIAEVQYAPTLMRHLKILIDENREENGKWILTGSQQFNLMQQASESLAGRLRVLQLGTLSASELQQSGLLNNPSEQLWKGGFPEIWANNLRSDNFYEDYLQTYLERDLRQLLKVTNLRDYRRFLGLLAIRAGQLLNFSELAKDLGIAVNTVKAWVNVLESSGLIVLLPPYYQNLGKRLIKSPKVFFTDNGILCTLLNIHSTMALEASTFKGSIWENFVCVELLKNGFVAGRNLFFYRDQNAVEIDFVLDHNSQITLIEAKSNELPQPQKLNFSKVQPLFAQRTLCAVACTIDRAGFTELKEYSLYNPLLGFQW